MDWSVIVVALISSVFGGGLVALLKVGSERRNIEAGTATKLWARVDKLQQDLDTERLKRRELEDRVEILEGERDEWKRGALVLTDQVVESGEEPRWRWQECFGELHG